MLAGGAGEGHGLQAQLLAAGGQIPHIGGVGHILAVQQDVQARGQGLDGDGLGNGIGVAVLGLGPNGDVPGHSQICGGGDLAGGGDFGISRIRRIDPPGHGLVGHFALGQDGANKLQGLAGGNAEFFGLGADLHAAGQLGGLDGDLGLVAEIVISGDGDGTGLIQQDVGGVVAVVIDGGDLAGSLPVHLIGAGAGVDLGTQGDGVVFQNVHQHGGVGHVGILVDDHGHAQVSGLHGEGEVIHGAVAVLGGGHDGDEPAVHDGLLGGDLAGGA